MLNDGDDKFCIRSIRRDNYRDAYRNIVYVVVFMYFGVVTGADG